MAGVAALPENTHAAAFAAVRAFDRFVADDDPYHEDDFGAVEVGRWTKAVRGALNDLYADPRRIPADKAPPSRNH